MTNEFTAYSRSTGKVLYCGTASDPSALESASVAILPGIKYGGGWLENANHYEQPMQPGPHHVFDWAIKQWIDPRTLQDLRDTKWTEIKRARSTAEYGGFVWDGSTFDSDAISQARIQGAVQLAGMAPSFSIDWTLQDNAVRTLSAADILAVGIALGAHVALQFSRAQALRVLVDSAESADVLDALGW